MKVTKAALRVVGEMQNAANDDADAAAIERAAVSLGLLGNCRGEDGLTTWTNPGTAKKCEKCGRRRPRGEE